MLTAPRVRVNENVGRYHLGWILYVWAGRPEAWLRQELEERSGATVRG